MKRVIVESPYKADSEEILIRNIVYAKAAVRDCLARGEAPFASHLFYTQEGLLDDDMPHERQQGIEAGLVWGEAAELTVVYGDFGISHGMQLGIDRAIANGRPIEYRSLPHFKSVFG